MSEKKPFQTKLSTYKYVLTSDGSYTLNSSLFNETLHSHHGANNETDYIYIEGCLISERINTSLSILEVGWGMGLGFQRTLLALGDNAFQFISLELDESLVEYTLKEMGFSENDYCKKEDKQGLKSIFLKRTNHPETHVEIYIGDARQVVHTFSSHSSFSFKAIYQDPFSPKKNPTLWTQEWFEDLKKLAHPSCILSTYSASTRVKLSLYHAGWSVIERKGFSNKKSSTIARLDIKTDEALIDKLETHKIGPFKDKELYV